MKQTGLLTKKQPTDYLAGTLVLDKVMPTRDWRPYIPMSEKQYDYHFDTMSCTTFATLNTIELWINYYIKSGKMPIKYKNILSDLGFMASGQFNASDRFTAIMSGTMPQGNYAQNVFDSIRHDGLLPEQDFPFGGNNWYEYHDKNKITPAMKEKAKKILEIFEWVYEYTDDIGDALQYTPLAGAIPKAAYHFVALPYPNYIFDTYPPFLYERLVDVAYSFKFVTKLKPMNTLPNVEMTRTIEDSKQTLGILEAYNNGAKFTCKTLERPNKNNLPNISSIPRGTYTCKWKFMPSQLKFHYQVMDVPGRTGIFFHSANYYSELKGCIALGSNLIDINGDGELDTTSSRITISAFENFMQKKDFKLTII